MTSPTHRHALDHVLALVADAPWNDGLVLRGSMAMTAWIGDAAREPADLDWVVVTEAKPVDPLDPFPYVELEDVQQWPEAAHGAARYEMWGEEEFGTDRRRPSCPPEGLHWIDENAWEPGAPFDDLVETVRQSPEAAHGVILEPERITDDGTWSYCDYETPGVRLSIPWHTRDGERGTVRLDFARDETLVGGPVWTRIPRADGSAPTVVRTASREQSLAWKLLWLVTDSATSRSAKGKDLYDAVLLAELPGMKLSRHVLRKVVAREFGASGHGIAFDGLHDSSIDWAGFVAEYPWVSGTADDWLARLDAVLRSVLETPSRSSTRTGTITS